MKQDHDIEDGDLNADFDLDDDDDEDLHDFNKLKAKQETKAANRRLNQAFHLWRRARPCKWAIEKHTKQVLLRDLSLSMTSSPTF